MKYNVKFTRVIEGQIEASSLEEAAKVAREHVAQIPGAKMLSILPEGYVDPDSKPPVDGDRDNNALANLRWATPKSNNADKVRHGTHLQRVGEALGRGVLNHTSVERIRDLRRAGCTYKEIAKWIRTTTSNVSSVLNGQTWSHV